MFILGFIVASILWLAFYAIQTRDMRKALDATKTRNALLAELAADAEDLRRLYREQGAALRRADAVIIRLYEKTRATKEINLSGKVLLPAAAEQDGQPSTRRTAPSQGVETMVSRGTARGNAVPASRRAK